MNKDIQEKETLSFAETKNSLGVVKKIHEAAAKEGRSTNNFLEQLFIKIFG